MKKVSVKLWAFVLFILCSNYLQANPIGVTFFNELVFDSTGWKLELNLSLPVEGKDSLSLKGWYLVSGSDTAYFKDYMYLKSGKTYHSSEGSNYLVLTKDSLNGKLNLDISGARLFLCSPEGGQRDWLSYGAEYSSLILRLNQSICRSIHGYYFDNSPTIGKENDWLGATGTINGIVKDAAGKPAANTLFYFYSPFIQFSKTDSLGCFKFDSLAAMGYTIIFYEWTATVSHNKSLTVSLQPDEIKKIDVQLDWVTDVTDENKTMVNGYSLGQNYPNPFNPVTTISYSVQNPGVVSLGVFDILGNEVRKLVNEYKASGSYRVSFDASDLNSGVYFYRFQAGSYSETKKLILVK